MAICPICKVDSVKKRFTWHGLLYAALCFPCGIYCCMKRRVWYCPLCTNEIYYSDGKEPSFSREYRCYKSFRKVHDSSFNTYQNEQNAGSDRDTTSPRTTTAHDERVTANTSETNDSTERELI